MEGKPRTKARITGTREVVHSGTGDGKRDCFPVEVPVSIKVILHRAAKIA
jgi:hypothetical protein